MLVCLCLSVTSCEQETAFSKYYNYLDGLENKVDAYEADKYISVDATAALVGNEDEEEKNIVFEAYMQSSVKVDAQNSMTTILSVKLYLKENSSTYKFTYATIEPMTGIELTHGEGDIAALSYTGEELVAFNTYKNDFYGTTYTELGDRQTATSLLKLLVLSMKPMMAKANVNVEDFYFISVDFPEVDGEAEKSEDLGGAFSAQRWTYVGQMLVVGLGMVFLVLAILWIVLIIFEKAMGTKPAQKKETQTAPETVTPPTPVAQPAPQADDGALVAAITAAIAAMIQSDENLQQEFKGGFRVVSFRKKNSRGAWND